METKRASHIPAFVLPQLPSIGRAGAAPAPKVGLGRDTFKRSQAPAPAPARGVPGGASAGDDPGKRRTSSGPGWTMAVNLSTTIREPDGKAVGGAELKSKELQELAASTAGKPVTIVAQELVKNPDYPGKTQDKSQEFVMRRYTIQDGQIKADPKLYPSKGYAGDLEDLVARAGKRNPGDKLGVITQSHGKAIDGMHGDQGDASLEAVTDGLRKGLQKAGRDKADTVSFDACLMGQSEVLERMQGLTDAVVASTETERLDPSAMGGGADGQNMKASLAALIANPGLDGQGLADKMVEVARENEIKVDRNQDGKADKQRPGKPDGSPGGGMPGGASGMPAGAQAAPAGAAPPPGAQAMPAGEAPPAGAAPAPEDPNAPDLTTTGTDTLASYHMAAYKEFRAAQDGLGDALADAARDPKKLATIKQLIQDTQRFAARADADGRNGAEQRDLKLFARKLQDAIDNGKLQDEGGKLTKAVAKLLEERHDLVSAYHGEEQGGYAEMGGIGAFLPDDRFFDVAVRGRDSAVDDVADSAARYLKELEEMKDLPPNMQEMIAKGGDMFTQAVTEGMNELMAGLPAEHKAALEPLAASVAALKGLPAGPARDAAVAKIAEAAKALADSPANAYLRAEARKKAQGKMEESFRVAQGDGQGGWNRFTRLLRANAKPDAEAAKRPA